VKPESTPVSQSRILGEIDSLRDWLDVVWNDGQLRRIEGAHWNLEIGEISEANLRQGPRKALLFTKIPDYPPDYGVLTGSVATATRLGATLGFGLGETDRSLMQKLRSGPTRWESEAERYQPRFISTGPVLSNAVDQATLNLLNFPAPKWHVRDGGRYIGTGCVVITSDPDSGAINAGAYRVQVQRDGTSATVSIVPGKHGAINVERWFTNEGRAPVVISFGHDPLLLVVAGTEVPHGVSELAYAGAIRAKAVEVVRADNGLPLPAQSELAVEGWFYPGDTSVEGPFGEWTGYYSRSTEEGYNLHMDRLYFRDDPVILGAPPGRPPHDYSYMRSVMKSAMLLDALEAAGVPGAQDVWAHECGGGRLLVAVAIDQAYPGHARQVGHLAAHLPAGVYMNRYTIVVDADVNVHNLDDVMWAVCTRSDPDLDIDVLSRTWGSSADPLLAPDAAPYMSRVVIDACVPFEARVEFPDVVKTPESRLSAVYEQWLQDS
jgi:UbiD family decarboxylase